MIKTLESDKKVSNTVVDLSIVIPAYNECENIRRLYEAISDVVKSLGLEIELIFIDDGSTDQTFEEFNMQHF